GGEDGRGARRAHLHRRRRHAGRQDHRLRGLVDARAAGRGHAEGGGRHHARRIFLRRQRGRPQEGLPGAQRQAGDGAQENRSHGAVLGTGGIAGGHLRRPVAGLVSSHPLEPYPERTRQELRHPECGQPITRCRMRRASLYSNSPRSRAVVRPQAESPEKPVEAPRKRKWRNLYSAYERQLLFGAMVLLFLLSLSSHFRSEPPAQTMAPPAADPSPVATVFNAVQGAIVRIRTATDAPERDDPQRGSGSGVVIVNRGTILTSLHGVAGASRIRVMFADGLESEAKIVSRHPENDLAVLQAQTVP